MRIVVTGGAGFVGSHLCQRLLRDGHEVVSLDNYSTGSPANVAHLQSNPSFRQQEADVTHEVRVDGDVDAVMHFASPASPIDYHRLPIETLRAGSVGTIHALELAEEKDARFILASTSECYGNPAIHPQPETYWGSVNPIGPRSVYDEAKRFSEAATMAYKRTRGVDVGIIRIFNTFGPRMRPEDGRAIPTFIRQALRGEPLTVAGDGTQTRSLCYVDDLVSGAVRLLQSDSVGPVNIGNPHEVSMLDLACWINSLVGSLSEITFVPLPIDDPVIRQPDITLARTTLNWEPQVAVEDGLMRTIAWFRESLGIDHALSPSMEGEVSGKACAEWSREHLTTSVPL